MTKKLTSLKILELHQEWRRGGDMAMLSCEEVGIAIDDAIAALRERDVARRCAVQQVCEIKWLWNALEAERRAK